MEVIKRIEAVPGVKAVSGRTLVERMTASATSTFGVDIVGIDPGRARQVTDIYNLMVAGTYFGTTGKNLIVVGKKLADRLNLKLHLKVVLSFQTMQSTTSFTPDTRRSNGYQLYSCRFVD
jgi:ABC-type lipoprotein release transport system permease subunit